MPTQDQHQYHFKLSDARCLSAVHTQRDTHTQRHTHSHTTKRYTFIIGLKHNYHHDNHAHKYQYRQNSAKMQLFPKQKKLEPDLSPICKNKKRPEWTHGVGSDGLTGL